MVKRPYDDDDEEEEEVEKFVRPPLHSGLPPLRSMLKNSTARFCCGGVAALNGPVRVFFDAPKSPGLASVLDFPGFPGDAMRELVEAGEPATFGRGKEDVLDLQYRQASKMAAARIAIGGFSPQDLVLDEIRRIMAPDAAGLRAELHSLSVYSKGSFFRPHVDTPRGEAHIGSLVVCLASPFTGGKLAVRHGGVEVPFDWAAGSTTADSVVQWGAFYSDVEHEVLPVTSGHRVTLAYNLYVQPGGEELPPPGASLCPEALSLVGVLRALLADTSFYPAGAKLGFRCAHRYPTTIDGKRAEPLPGGLKGADRVLYAAAKALDLEVAFASWFHQEWDEDKEPMLLDGINCGCTSANVDYGCGDDDVAEGLKFSVKAEQEIVWCVDPRPVQKRAYGSHDKDEDITWAYAAHGNDYSVGVLYAASCIIVKVPPSAARKPVGAEA